MSKSWWVSALVGLGAMTVAGAAAADPKTHDGFYFRGATGLGYTNSSISYDPAVQGFDNASVGGVSIGFDAWFGGSPVPGLAIGGGLTGYDVPSPKLKLNGQSLSANGSETLSIVALFGDYYFDPNAGMHAEAIIGYGALSFQNANGDSSSNSATGLALGLGFGNDWWVSDEWSIGVLGRFIYAPLSYSSGGLTEKLSTITPAVMATFTYH